MDISNLDKIDVLIALYNHAQPQGIGIIHYDPKPMTREQAENILGYQTYFDYLKGRVMKIDLSGDDVRTDLYNRDNGERAAEEAIAALVKKG